MYKYFCSTAFLAALVLTALMSFGNMDKAAAQSCSQLFGQWPAVHCADGNSSAQGAASANITPRPRRRR